MALSNIIISLVFLAFSSVAQDCSESQLNSATMRFKDCMEEKKATLLQIDTETDTEEGEVTLLICDGLKDLSTGCIDAVNEFSICRGREHVDHLVAIHLNAITDVLAPFHPSLELKACPVFHTPAPPTIVKRTHSIGSEPVAEPEYEPITGTATLQTAILPVTLILSCLTLLTA